MCCQRLFCHCRKTRVAFCRLFSLHTTQTRTHPHARTRVHTHTHTHILWLLGGLLRLIKVCLAAWCRVAVDWLKQLQTGEVDDGSVVGEWGLRVLWEVLSKGMSSGNQSIADKKFLFRLTGRQQEKTVKAVMTTSCCLRTHWLCLKSGSASFLVTS